MVTVPYPGVRVQRRAGGGDVELEVLQKPSGLYELTIFGRRYGRRAILTNHDDLTLGQLDALLASVERLI